MGRNEILLITNIFKKNLNVSITSSLFQISARVTAKKRPKYMLSKAEFHKISNLTSEFFDSICKILKILIKTLYQ